MFTVRFFLWEQNMVKNFLRMGTRDRLRLVIFVLLFVGAVLLWPILFCAKVDGDTSASWVALWTPLWIYNALGEREGGGGRRPGMHTARSRPGERVHAMERAERMD